MSHGFVSASIRTRVMRAGWGVAWCATLAAAVAAASSTYKVDIESELNGLDIKISTVENPGGLIVRLRNDGTQKARCDLRYDASPQPLARRTVYVDAGKTAESVFGAKRQWFQVDVKINCGPVAK